MKTVVDLRSDTVTRPTAAMREAIARAEVGDDVFGDDPSVNALQEKIAILLGKQAALFVASGTQGNLCALMSHCQRGDEALVGQMAHTYRYEAGGAAVLGSVQPQPLPQQPDGTLCLEDIEAAIKPDDEHFAPTRLLCLENTWNGQVLAQSYLDAATALAHRRGLATHLDGARLWNAAVASAMPVAEIARGFDSVSVCFSKGLGAPVGSALVGSAAFIARARRVRKALGGGMRQVGLLAAAASYALVASPTNIVFASVEGGRGPALLAHLERRGVLATGLIGLRFVTHLDVDVEGVDRAVAAVREYLND
jgi:threonine aldolase